MVFEGWFLILCSRAQPTVVAGFWRLVLFQIKEMHLSEQVDSPHHAELPNVVFMSLCTNWDKRFSMRRASKQALQFQLALYKIS